MTLQQQLHRLEAGGLDDAFLRLHPNRALNTQKSRLARAFLVFAEFFGSARSVRVFSAPGRIEIGGNHTDHQHGRAIAAAVDLDVLCVASPQADGVIRIRSAGYPPDEIPLDSLAPVSGEQGRSAALIRGVAAQFRARGFAVGGFDAVFLSDVPVGSGLSSSAAFEVAVGITLSGLYNGGVVPPAQIAAIGRYAENVYFGKPCGLMDQTACAVGGCISLDFADPENPSVTPIRFEALGRDLCICIVSCGDDHADLTEEYAAIPAEMGRVAHFFEKQGLREVDTAAFYSAIPALRRQCGDRAVLRAIHFFGENERVSRQTDALSRGHIADFLALVAASGRSSAELLQNLYAARVPEKQGIPLALALTEQLLGGQGACRVHGGGFAGTILALVPTEQSGAVIPHLEAVFGRGACRLLAVREAGGVELV